MEASRRHIEPKTCSALFHRGIISLVDPPPPPRFPHRPADAAPPCCSIVHQEQHGGTALQSGHEASRSRMRWGGEGKARDSAGQRGLLRQLAGDWTVWNRLGWGRAGSNHQRREAASASAEESGEGEVEGLGVRGVTTSVSTTLAGTSVWDEVQRLDEMASEERRRRENISLLWLGAEVADGEWKAPAAGSVLAEAFSRIRLTRWRPQHVTRSCRMPCGHWDTET